MYDETTAERPADERPARSGRRGRTAGLLAGGALAGAVVAGVLPAVADSTSPSASNDTATSAPASANSDNPNRDPSKPLRSDETLLTGDVAQKLRDAALAAVPGATVQRVETDADGDKYEAHIVKSDGTQATVKLDANAKLTWVETGGRGGHHSGRHADDSRRHADGSRGHGG